MRKFCIRICVCLVALSMLVSLLSCANDQNPQDATPTPTQSPNDTVTPSATPTEPLVNWESAGIPKQDFNQSFTFLVRNSGTEYAWYAFTSEAKDGETLNDAIYSRNATIAEQFNITFASEAVASPMTVLDREISAGDAHYDAINDFITEMYASARGGKMYNWHDVPNVDLDAEWWDQGAIEQLTYNDKLYFCIGDISPVVNIRVYSICINKDLCKSLGLELPYSYVSNGTWTIEVFDEYITNVNMDLNGDDTMNYKDRWGYFSQTNNSLMMYIAGGGSVVRLNAYGEYELVFQDEKNIDIATRALEITNDATKTLKADPYVQGEGGSWQAASAWFAAGNALLRESALEPVVRDYRSMETDFGVLPFPKFDEDQEQYYSMAEETSRFVAIPITADAKFSGTILTLLSAESVSTVSPAFYDTCLNGRSVRDNESIESLQIIFNSKVFDIGMFLNIGGIKSQFTALENKKSSDIGSAFESVAEAAQTALTKLIEDLDQLS